MSLMLMNRLNFLYKPLGSVYSVRAAVVFLRFSHFVNQVPNAKALASVFNVVL
jgi:hypothetical protein